MILEIFPSIFFVQNSRCSILCTEASRIILLRLNTWYQIELFSSSQKFSKNEQKTKTLNLKGHKLLWKKNWLERLHRRASLNPFSLKWNQNLIFGEAVSKTIKIPAKKGRKPKKFIFPRITTFSVKKLGITVYALSFSQITLSYETNMSDSGGLFSRKVFKKWKITAKKLKIWLFRWRWLSV